MGKIVQQSLTQVDFSKMSDHFAWYTVVTKFNYETKFVSELLSKVEKNDYLLQFFEDIFIPEKKCTVEYINAKGNTAKRIVTDKTMSLYVFVKAKIDENIYWLLRNTTGCATILATGDTLVTLTEEEILHHRNDANITEDMIKGMRIITKMNPFFNPFLALKDKNVEQEQFITVKDKKSDGQQAVEQNRDIYTRRTKAESLPTVNDINPQLFLQRLKKRSLTDQFLQLSGKDVSFLSDNDLAKLQSLVKTAQDEKKRPNTRTVIKQNLFGKSQSVKIPSTKKKQIEQHHQQLCFIYINNRPQKFTSKKKNQPGKKHQQLCSITINHLQNHSQQHSQKLVQTDLQQQLVQTKTNSQLAKKHQQLCSIYTMNHFQKHSQNHLQKFEQNNLQSGTNIVKSNSYEKPVVEKQPAKKKQHYQQLCSIYTINHLQEHFQKLVQNSARVQLGDNKLINSSQANNGKSVNSEPTNSKSTSSTQTNSFPVSNKSTNSGEKNNQPIKKKQPLISSSSTSSPSINSTKTNNREKKNQIVPKKPAQRSSQNTVNSNNKKAPAKKQSAQEQKKRHHQQLYSIYTINHFQKHSQKQPKKQSQKQSKKQTKPQNVSKKNMKKSNRKK